jgi:hypothetical protein
MVEIMQGKQLRSSAEAQACSRVPDRRGVTRLSEFRVEAGIRAAELIDELELVQHRDIGENVLDGQKLSPARMADHEIRPKTLLSEPRCLLCNSLRALAFHMEVLSPRMQARRSSSCELVALMRHCWDAWGAATADRLTAVPCRDQSRG